MENYEALILAELKGETPRQKYDYMKEMQNIYERENNSGVEATLLKWLDKMTKTYEEMFKSSGGDSYVERCHLYDAYTLIYRLTNKNRIEKIDFIKWREALQNRK